MTKSKWLKLINLLLVLLNVFYLIYFVVSLLLTVSKVGVFGTAFFVISIVTIAFDFALTILDIIISKNS